MLPRLFIAIGLASLAALCVAAPIACSSSQRRDQYYGTDQGSDYQPEAGVFDGSSDDALESDDVGDAAPQLDRPLSADAPSGLDAPARLDAPVDLDAPAQPDAPSESDADIAS
jgi:hypothetical protein